MHVNGGAEVSWQMDRRSRLREELIPTALTLVVFKLTAG